MSKQQYISVVYHVIFYFLRMEALKSLACKLEGVNDSGVSC